MGYCYLLHFDQPISEKHTCQHYLGYTSKSIKARIEEHRTGAGARLTQVALERGISFIVVRTWKNMTRSDERRLKNRKAGPRLCPVCQSLSIKENDRHAA